MTDFQHLRLVEALLFASADPLDDAALAKRLPKEADLAAILDQLRQTYEGRGVVLERSESGWAFRTAPDLAAAMALQQGHTRKLSRAAIETLAIIAYHQPVTRAEIEEIRGVMLGKGTLDTLFEAGWIRPDGHRQAPGKPVLWATAPDFLDHFGLATLDDLPGLDELKAAGLLDSRPGLSSYAARASDEIAPLEDGPEADREDAEEEALDEAELEQRALADLETDAAEGKTE